MIPAEVYSGVCGYEGLAAAVVKQAVVDLRSVCPHDQASARRFFRNRGGMLELWCGLANIDHETVARMALSSIEDVSIQETVTVAKGVPDDHNAC
jgi:hypothetical protein